MPDPKPWHEQDEFWDHVCPVLFGTQRLADAPADVDNLIALLGLEPGMAVLDLCCGVGRHSLELARRGFQVTAVDRTERYLERASQQAAADGLEVEFVCEDMREFCHPGAFDVVLNLFTSFGIFEVTVNRSVPVLATAPVPPCVR